jgi:hypothetical protein
MKMKLPNRFPHGDFRFSLSPEDLLDPRGISAVTDAAATDDLVSFM